MLSRIRMSIVTLVVLLISSAAFGETPSLSKLTLTMENDKVHQYATQFDRSLNPVNVKAVKQFLLETHKLDGFKAKEVVDLDSLGTTVNTQNLGVLVKSSKLEANLISLEMDGSSGTTTKYTVRIHNETAKDGYIQELGLLVAELDGSQRGVWKDVQADKVDLRISPKRMKAKGTYEFTLTYSGGNFEFVKSLSLTTTR